MDDMFRSVFGFGRRHRDSSECPNNNDFLNPHGGLWGQVYPEEPHENSPPNHFSFTFSENHDMFQHFNEMFRSFDEAFKHMGIAEFPPPSALPRIGESEEHESARDHMLKQPDTQPFDRQNPSVFQPPQSFFGGIWGQPHQQPRFEDKIDKDLDGDVDLSTILPAEQPSVSREPRHSFQHRTSVHTFRRSADGTMEEERIVSDGSGNEQRTVTHTVDGQTHSVTTHTAPDGTQQVTEDFLNVDKDEQADFASKFQQDPPSADMLRPSTGLFKNLIRSWFF